jgi:hypothetical protein
LRSSGHCRFSVCARDVRGVFIIVRAIVLRLREITAFAGVAYLRTKYALGDVLDKALDATWKSQNDES